MLLQQAGRQGKTSSPTGERVELLESPVCTHGELTRCSLVGIIGTEEHLLGYKQGADRLSGTWYVVALGEVFCEGDKHSNSNFAQVPSVARTVLRISRLSVAITVTVTLAVTVAVTFFTRG